MHVSLLASLEQPDYLHQHYKDTSAMYQNTLLNAYRKAISIFFFFTLQHFLLFCSQICEDFFLLQHFFLFLEIKIHVNDKRDDTYN